MKRSIVLALALAACSKSSSTTSAPTKADPAPPKPAASATGKVVTAKLESKALGVTKDVVVYLPASYDTSNKRYPVFYYLHGLGGDETNWVEGGKLDKTADALGIEAIVVMPDGDDGFYVDSPKQVDYDACMKDGTGLFMPGHETKRTTCVHKRDYDTYITKDLQGNRIPHPRPEILRGEVARRRYVSFLAEMGQTTASKSKVKKIAPNQVGGLKRLLGSSMIVATEKLTGRRTRRNTTRYPHWSKTAGAGGLRRGIRCWRG